MGKLEKKKPVEKKKKKSRGSDGQGQTSIVDANSDNSLSASTAKKTSHIPKKNSIVSSKTQQLINSDNAVGRLVQFLREVKVELKKVTWPQRNQTIGSTIVVIVLVMIISIFLGLVDIGLSNVVRLILG